MPGVRVSRGRGVLRMVALLAVAVPTCRPAERPIGAAAQVTMVGPGVLSTGQVYGGTLSANGDELYFFRKVGEGETYRIYRSERTGDEWMPPAPLDLGGAHSDLYPALAHDGRRLIFSSYRPLPGTDAPSTRAQLWSVERRSDGSWGVPVFMRAVSTPGSYHSWLAVDRQGHLYFRRTSSDWRTSETLWARWDGTAYAAPQRYDPVARWQAWRADVRVVGGVPSPDGQLVFLDVATRNPLTGAGASDLWVSRREGNAWSSPVPLQGGVNADGYEVFPFVSPDGRDLYFVRDFSAFHTVPLAAALASPPQPVVRYVANAGVSVDVEGRRFLIDAVFRDGIAPYAVSTPDERTRIEQAQGPYADVDALLVTHWHDDHFDAAAVAEHLERNPRAVLISSPEVVDLVRPHAPRLAPSRLQALVPAPGGVATTRVGDVPVRVIRARHNPSRRFPEQHVAFLIGERAPVLHVGDADPKADNFAALQADLPRVALAFLPFWYLSDPAARSMVADVIRPLGIVAIHVPPRDAADVQRALRDAGVVASVAVRPGTVIDDVSPRRQGGADQRD